VKLNPTSAFNARTWLTTLLPANYAKKVLVLADPNSGCNFAGTTLQYGDGSAAVALDLLKCNLFVRLWKKLGWTLDEIDRAPLAFFPSNAPAFSDAGFSAAFTAPVYLAHLDDLNTTPSPHWAARRCSCFGPIFQRKAATRFTASSSPMRVC
jgi:hypothetical protein